MTVDFKPVAWDGAANVETQVQYLVDLAPGGSLEHGYQAGTALSAQFNKTIRQCSMITAGFANWVANILGEDMLDDGVLATMIDKITRAISAASWTTGDVKLTLKAVADAGWVLMNDGTIGDAASGANYANNNALALFTLLWNNTLDLWCPVVTGRGGSAALDWAAHKKIALPRALGRALAVSGAGAGFTARALAQNLGEETHMLTGAESGTHAHGHRVWVGGAGTGGSYAVQVAINLGPAYSLDGGFPASPLIEQSPAANATDAHNNMQPTLFLNVMIKL